MSESILIYITLFTLFVFTIINLYFFINRGNKSNNSVATNDLDRLKQDFNNSFSNMSSSFNKEFTSLSKDVTKDMTEALTKVDEKVGSFNKQVEG